VTEQVNATPPTRGERRRDGAQDGADAPPAPPEDAPAGEGSGD